jgi:drug/metabolite transporter (DMT)-like permease
VVRSAEHSQRDTAAGYGFVILSFAILGTGVPLSKDAVALIPVLPFTVVTLAIGCAFMLPMATIIDRVRWTQISQRNYLKIALQALIAAILYTVFLLYGLQRTTAVAAAVINSITPAVVLIMSVAFLRERLSARKVLAIAMAVLAVALMSTATNPGDGAAQTTPIGVAFVLFSVLSLAVFLIFAKRLSTELPPTTLAAGLLVAAFLLALPLGLYDGLHFDWSTVSRKCWYETLYYGVGIWALPFWTTYLGISKIPASAAGMATALTPLTAIATAVGFYGERLTWQAVVALLLVVTSIAIAELQDAQGRSPG